MLQTATTQTIPVANSIGHTHTHQKGKHTKTDGYRLCFYLYATSSVCVKI